MSKNMDLRRMEMLYELHGNLTMGQLWRTCYSAQYERNETTIDRKTRLAKLKELPLVL